MDKLQLEITDGKYNYGQFEINNYLIIVVIPSEVEHESRQGKRRFRLDGVFVHYLMKELGTSRIYRQSFLEYNFRKRFNNTCDYYVIFLLPTKCDLIDYNWNERIYVLVREKAELDHTLSWLSTLGGAFSALGDYASNCAVVAGTISIHQLKLALRLGDPLIQARCRLYFSLSLIQRKYFKLARKIILTEYFVAKNASIVDKKLMNMCKGIWAKLQYEHKLHKNKTGA